MKRRSAMLAAAVLLLGLGVALSSGCDSPERAADAATPERASPFNLQEVAGELGLSFQSGHGGRSPLSTLETLGHGAAVVDLNGDHYPDVWLLSSRGSTYYRSVEGRRFEDATAEARANLPGYWHGVTAGDFDGDGDTDLCQVGYGCLALIRNDGGVFRDATAASGLMQPEWGSSCAFADLDGDGRLDLLVGEYLDFDAGPRLCTVGEIETACGPKIYPALYPRVYRNLGEGRFEDVTKRWGFDTASGKALGIALGDYNGDGRLDVAFANDEMPQDLFIRKPGPEVRFQNQAVELGFAYLGTGRVQSGMGIDAADFDGDGREDLLVTNFQNEPAGLYRNEGGYFTEHSGQAGVAEATFPYVGWGCRFFDADGDGDLDLAMANGHIEDNVARVRANTSYAQPLLLFENREGRFRRVTPAAGDPWEEPFVGRGLVVADIDNDGAPDLLATNLEGPIKLLKSASPGYDWMGLEVLSRGGAALGARVVAEWDRGQTTRRVPAGGSIFSAQDPRLQLAIPEGKTLQRLRVDWPDGTREAFTPPPLGRYSRLVQGTGARL
ncbi:MAG: CRTAC1 family protein [Armatimonadota bacterium]